MNYYPRWIRAIRGKTIGLTMAQMGAYDRLLDSYYENEHPLSADVRECYRIAGAASKQDRDDVQLVLTRFFILTERGWEQERAEAEVASARPKIDAARNNGRYGGRPKGSTKKPSGFPKKTDAEPDPKALQSLKSSSSNEELPPLPPAVAGGFGFPEFWEAYPKVDRKAARLQCLEKWEKKGFAAIADRILAGLEAAKRTPGWLKDGGAYIPAPLVWLNEARWEAFDSVAEAWHETAGGIKTKGAALGIPYTDEDGCQPFSVYRDKVFVKAGFRERTVA